MSLSLLAFLFLLRGLDAGQGYVGEKYAELGETYSGTSQEGAIGEAAIPEFENAPRIQGQSHENLDEAPYKDLHLEDVIDRTRNSSMRGAFYVIMPEQSCSGLNGRRPLGLLAVLHRRVRLT
jgi:hypothetical protein